MSTSRTAIKKKLEILVKSYVKTRDNYTCQRCGKKLEKSNCHASHIFPVSKGLMWAYDPENIITLCFHCHINFWHKNPTEAYLWFVTNFKKKYQYLTSKILAYKTREIKNYELEELYERLKKTLVQDS